MKKIYASLLIAVFALVANLNAQNIAVTITSGATNTTPNLGASYTSFANFVTAINGITAVSGPVVATLAAGTNETAPIKGFNISTSTANVFTNTNTLTIVKASGAATVINAGVGTSLGATASSDGMLYLSGMDGVTIDGITFTDGNTTTSTVAMEFGIAFFKRAVGDGCNNNTVQNCIFNMQRINNAAASGPMAVGSCAIQVLNSTPAAAITALTPTNGGTLATNGTNSNNRFYSNTTNNGNGGINLSGFAAVTGVGPSPTATTFLGDINNDIGGAGAGTANSILNYGGGAATNQATGIIVTNQWSVNISYNTLDNNNGSGVNHTGVLMGISNLTATSSNATISNNSVTIRGGGTTQAITAINNSSGSTAAANTVNINSNTIRFSYTTATTGLFSAVTNSSTAAAVNINSNNIQQLGSTNYPSTGTVLAITGGSPGGTLNMTNNTVSNFIMSGASGTFRAITSATPVGLSTITGNTVENISYSAATSTGSITGIYNLSSATLQNINTNIIRNFSTPTTGTLNGIQNNTVAGTFQCKNNQIYNFTTTAGGAGGFSANGITWSNANVEISGNIIYAINSTGTTGGTTGTINGITFSGAANVFNNAIYDLSSTSTNATINGIAVAATGTNNVYNNLIGNISATKSTGNIAISGILVSSGTTNNIYHNTVYIASTTTSATTFGTSAIYFSSSTPVNNLRNNVFVNVSNPGPTGGFTAAIRYTIAPTSTNFPSTNNNNLYYAGVAAANKVLYCEGSTATPTNGMQTAATYKTYISTTLPVAGREGSSVSENPVWQSTTGSNPITTFLKYNTGSATQIEQGAGTGTGITTDFSGSTLRCPNGLCPGGASLPDMGAWELAGTLADLTAPTVSFTALGNSCTAGNRTFSATITDASGVATSGTGLPVIYWKINAGAYTSTQATWVSGTGYTFSLGTGSVAGNVVSYYIAAQDNNGNVGSTPSGGESGVSTFPPAFSTPPTTPNTYTVLTSLAAGTYSIGTGSIGGEVGHYATLTAAIAAYNANCIGGNITFALTDALYGTGGIAETFPLVINANPGSGASNILTIKPNTGVTASIIGSVASNALIQLNGADYVVIDGSNNGSSTRNLTVTNSNTTSPTAISLISLGANTGATANTIKNLNITTGTAPVVTSYGITIGGATPGTAGSDNDNVIIQNNNISSVLVGVYANGNANVSSLGSDNVAIVQNNINISSAVGGVYGIRAGNIITGNINQNTIKVVQTLLTGTPVAISLEAGYNNSIVSKNRIDSAYCPTSGGYAGRGIVIGTTMAASNLSIINNVIYGVTGSNYLSFGNSSAMGIAIGVTGNSSTITTVAGGIKLYHNSVYMTGTSTYTGVALTAAIYIGSAATALDIRNNIFANTLAATTAGATSYCMYSAAANTAFTFLDYNDYYTISSMTNATGYVGFLGSAQSTLANWQAATAKDGNSKAADPLFQSAKDLRPGIGSAVLSSGDNSFLGTVPDDYLGTTRNDPPSIGAYEVGADVLAPSITHSALAGTCATGDRTVTATIADGSGVDITASYKPRVYYRKGAGTWYSQAGTLASGSANTGTWNFTIVAADMGGLAVNDVVSYYIIAQDNVSPTPNITSNPATGLVASDVLTVTTPPTTPNSYGIQNTLAAGTYSVGAGTVPGEVGHYATLTAAVASYNTSCLVGSVVFALTDASYNSSETFPITISANGFASGANQLVIKPATGVTAVTITGSSTAALIKLNGADYVTINGSNNLTGTKDLTIVNTNTATTGNGVIWVASASAGDSATNNTIKNCIISGDASTTTQMGIFEGPTAAIAATQTFTLSSNINNIYQNNTIYKVQNGIWVIGKSTTFLTTGTQIKDNNIGTTNSGEGPGVMGIYATLRDAAVIDNNVVQNLNTTTNLSAALGGTTINGGIFVQDSKNTSVTKNDVHNLITGGTSSIRLYGIAEYSTNFNTVGNPALNLFANNIIYDLHYTGTGATSWQATGLNTNGGYGDKFYNNSVYLTGSPINNVTSGPNAAFANGNAIVSTAAVDIVVRNNIFAYNGTQTVGQYYNYYTTATDATIIASATVVNNNNYYRVVTGGATGAAIRTGTATAGETLTAWQTSVSRDANSNETNPQFISTTNLHINPSIKTQVESGGVALAGVTTDFDGDLRFGQPGYAGTGTAPDMGADEGNFVPLTCFPASNLTASATNSTNATMSWTAALPAPSNGYVYEIRTSGLGGSGATGLAASGSVGAGVVTANTSGNPLTANTVYTAYVASYCGGSDYGDWIASATFTTPCNVINLPLAEGFNTTTIPTCWSKEIATGSVNATSYIGFVNSSTSETASPNEGAAFVRYNSFSASSGHTERLRVPAVSTSGLSGGIISFDWWQTSSATYSTLTERVDVEYSLDGINWTVINTYNRADPAANLTGGWYPKSTAIPAPALGQASIYFGLRFYSDFGYNCYLDNFKILPACTTPAVQPTALTFPSQGPTSVSGAFTVAPSVDSFLVVIYPAGSATTAPVNGTTYITGQTLGLGTVVKVTSTGSFNATGLTPATSYDFYVYSMNGYCSGGPLYRTASPLFGNQSSAACTGPVATSLSIGPGGDYDNMTEAFAFITNCGISGPTLLQLQSNYNENSETFPLVLGSIPGSSAVNILTIRPQGTKAPFSWSGSSANPLIDLSGVKNVLLDGRPGGIGSTRGITIVNTGTGPAVRFVNNAQNLTLRFVTMQASNPNPNSGVVVFATTSGTTLTDGNNNNTIDNCGINGNSVTPIGIYAAGSAAPADNKSNTFSNNDIYDYFSNASATNTNAGISISDNNAVSASSAWTISGNSFYQTVTPRTFSTMTNPVSAIFINPITAANRGVFTISNNKFGGTATNLGGSTLAYTGTTFTFQGLYLAAGAQGTTTVSGNTISKLAITSTNTSTSTIAGIYAPTGNITLNANTIGSATVPGSITYGGGSGTFFGIHASGVTSTNTALNITNNTIAGITLTGTSATGCMGIGLSSTATYSAACSITGNNIGTASAGITSSVTGAVSSLIWGISQLNAATFNITGNTITNFSSVATSTSTANQFRGINATGTGVNIIGAVGGANKNVISNFTTAAPNTGTGASSSIVAINIGSTTTGQSVVNNEITGLRNTATAASSISVVGIVTGSITTGTGDVRLNRIWDLTNTSTGTSGFIAGIWPTATAGTWTYANNMISLTNAANTNGMQLCGVYDISAGGTRNYYFNSIYIAGSSAGTQNSVAFQRNYSATLTNIDVQNNIIQNARTGGGSNYAIANVFASVPPTTGWTSGYNVLNATNTAKLGLWGAVGTNDRTYAAFKSVSGSVGGYSGITIPFVSTATGDLHLNFGATASAIESGGNIGTTGITTDFDGQARPGPLGSVRLGAVAADIGADEYDGAQLSQNVGALALATPAGACVTGSQTIEITIKNFAGTALNMATYPVTVSGTVINPSAVSTPFSVTINTGTLVAGATQVVQVLTGYDMSAVGNYTIDAATTLAGDEDNSNDAMATVIKAKVALVTGTASSSVSDYCVTAGKPTLTLTGSTGGDIQWQQSTTGVGGWANVGTLNSTTYIPGVNITQTMYYQALVSCGTTNTSNIVTVTFNNPQLLTYTASKSRCGTGAVTLNATTNVGSTINWYATLTGTAVATGTTYTTGILPNDTTIYVSASAGGSSGLTIPGDGDWQHVVTTGAFQTTANTGMTIVVSQNLTLSSVDIYPSATIGTAFSIVVRANTSGGAILQTYNGNTTVQNSVTPTVAQTVPVNFTLAPGTYHISFPTNPNTWRSGATTHTYPWAIPGLISLNYDLTPSYQYYFYNLRLSTGCETNRVAIPVTLTSAPAIALDQSNLSVCSGTGGTVSVTPGTKSNYTLFKWSSTPNTGYVPGGSPNGSSVFINQTNATSVATTQVYTLTASGGGLNGQCGNQASVTVTINPKPSDPVTTGAQVCQNGTSTTMSASSTPAATTLGGSVTFNLSNAGGNEGTSFTTAKVLGSVTLPALPAGATYTSARFLINGILGLTDPTNGQTFGSEVRLGLKTTGGANLTTAGYQGTTVTTSPNPFDYATLTTNADSTSIGSVIPSTGGTFNIVYYETIDDVTTGNDVTFPATGTFVYKYSLPTTYNWYTTQYNGSPIGTGASFNPVGVVGSGLANTAVAGNYTYYVNGSNLLCNSNNRSSVVYSIASRPVPTFTSGATATTCANNTVVYTTQSGRSNYSWTVSGTNNVDYQVTGGALNTTSNTVTIRWLTTGAKTVTVNYSVGSCAGLAAASNATTVLTTGAASVTITGSATTCYGGAVTYTATPSNGGSAPIYQWKKDGANVGTNSATYRDAGIAGGVITCVMTSNFGCLSGSPTPTSNAITLTVTANAWTGAVSTDFNNGANWCAGVVPTQASNISIPSSATNMPRLTNNFAVNNLTLNSGGTLDVSAYRLIINGAISGSGYIKGSTSGTLYFTGNGALGTLNMDPTAKSLKVLQFTGTGSLTLGNALDIYDSVDVDAATLTTGGLLTLKSVQASTARVGAITAGNVVGNVTVERWLRNVSIRTFRLLSVPTQGSQTIKQAWQENQAPMANGNAPYGILLTSTFGVAQGYDATTSDNSVQVWNPGTSTFDYAGPTSSTPIASRGGYYVYVRGDRSLLVAGSATTTSTLRTTGNLYTGTQPVQNITGGVNTVVGNVYASAIDFTRLQQSGGITSFKLWDAQRVSGSTTASGDAYQTFSAANGWAAVPGGGSYLYAPVNTRIESGQAFVVSPSGAETITFTEYAKTTGSRQLQRENNVIRRFKTNMYVLAKGVAPALVDGNVVVFDNAYATGIDNYDVIKMSNTSENLAVSNSGKVLIIDARPEVVSSDVIQFALSNMKAQDYSLEFTTENMDPLLTATLEDSYLKTNTPIVLNSTQTITFKVTGDAASYSMGRFRVVFKGLSTLPVTFTTVRANANDRNNTIGVEWGVSGEKDIRSYAVEYSTDGRTFSIKGDVLSTGNNSVSTKTYNWIHETPNQGLNYYRIKSISLSGAVKYSTIVRASLGDMSSSFTVAPNPVRDGNVTVQFENKPEGRYNIRLINSSGQVVLTQIANHAGGNSSYRLRIGSTLSSGLYKVEILSPEKTRYVHNLVISNGK